MSAEQASEPDVRFRKMVRSDLDSVLRIEEECFERPWTRKTFWQWLSTPEVKGELLLCGDRLVGFVLWTIEPGQLHVLNLAVRKSEWRKGYGSLLVERAHRAAVDAG
ncbi:MAG: GNAT family N-acetyltransferase, partial [Planctomycetota bacterium]